MNAVERLDAAVEKVLRRKGEPPRIGVVLGSGLGAFADGFPADNEIAYTDIPGFPPVAVKGHAGRLLTGRFGDRRIAVLQGRAHFYEGHSMADVVFPVRTLCRMGIEVLVLTNAAGGIKPGFSPGDLMIIRDHINLMGDNPLKGDDAAPLGPRFPDMSAAYDPALRHLATRILEEMGGAVHEGVYAAMSGPSYETPAEIRMLAGMGADAVGMSTVPETLAARHMGVRVAGISCITNLAAGIGDQALSHEEVAATAALASERFRGLLTKMLKRIPLEPPVRT